MIDSNNPDRFFEILPRFFENLILVDKSMWTFAFIFETEENIQSNQLFIFRGFGQDSLRTLGHSSVLRDS